MIAFYCFISPSWARLETQSGKLARKEFKKKFFAACDCFRAFIGVLFDAVCLEMKRSMTPKKATFFLPNR